MDIVADLSMSLCCTAIKSQYFRIAACISQFCRNTKIFKIFLGWGGEGEKGNLCVHLLHNLL